MGLKVNKCCCCIELRIGCIVLGATCIILAVISVALTPTWLVDLLVIRLIGIVLAIIGNGCLIFAAAYTSGTAQIRTNTTLVYIIIVLLNALLVLIETIMICVVWVNAAQILAGYFMDGVPIYVQMASEDHLRYAARVVGGIVVIILDLYFALVAWSFYQELKSGNTNVTGEPA